MTNRLTAAIAAGALTVGVLAGLAGTALAGDTPNPNATDCIALMKEMHADMAGMMGGQGGSGMMGGQGGSGMMGGQGGSGMMGGRR